MNYNGERRTYIHDDHIVFLVWSVRYGGWIPSLLTHSEIHQNGSRIYEIPLYPDTANNNAQVYESSLPLSQYKWPTILLTCNEYGQIVSWPYMSPQETQHIVCLPDASIWISRSQFHVGVTLRDVIQYENATYPRGVSVAYYHNGHGPDVTSNGAPALASLADLKKETKTKPADLFFTTNEKLLEDAIKSAKKKTTTKKKAARK
jgi:hypothetical protein